MSRKDTASKLKQCLSSSLSKKLNSLYKELNKKELIHPDPLEFVYNYNSPADREVAGLISASLAYGRVTQILKSVDTVLSKLTDSPSRYLKNATPKMLKNQLQGFKHRFTTDIEIIHLLLNIGRILKRYQTLENCFLASYDKNQETTHTALTGFAKELTEGIDKNSLIPSPERKSACKRLHLFLRWMVRRDEVDPGCWKSIPSSKLIIPLDTHMYNICKTLGFTKRKSSDLTTAMEITERFRQYNPHDPVAYDFAITRLGIRQDMTVDYLLSPSSSKVSP